MLSSRRTGTISLSETGYIHPEGDGFFIRLLSERDPVKIKETETNWFYSSGRQIPYSYSYMRDR
jgi:hypothetical protein